MPDSPPNSRKGEAIDSPRNNKLFGNWVQDKDGQMISYWDKQGSSSILFSPLMPKTAIEEEQQHPTETMQQTFSDSDIHDDDIGILDGLAPFRFEFDSDGEEEDTKETSENLNQPALSSRLQQLGYPSSLCYQAVNKHGNNMDAALRWLSSCAPSPLRGSNSGLWATPSNSSSPLSLSSSTVTPQEEVQQEYFTYTHNVKNNNKQLNSSLNNLSSSSSRVSPLPHSLTSMLPFSPSASINNPADEILAPDYYDLSKKV